MQRGTLDRITIQRLHGNKNIDVKFQDNTLILVGENGSGKTTFLRILFHVLSGHWLPLIQYNFKSIVITISGKNHEISHDSLKKSIPKIDHRMLSSLPPPVRHRLMESMSTGDKSQIFIEFERAISHYGIPSRVLMEQLSMLEDEPPKNNELKKKIKDIHHAMNAQILYLPTYRRIERELSSILPNADSDDLKRVRNRIAHSHEDRSETAFIELVEFGMKDVDKAIGSALESLKDFARQTLNNLTLKYLSDVVHREYENVGMNDIANTSDDTIHAILNRIDENILGIADKSHLFNAIHDARGDGNPNEHSKIICHYFLKLKNFQEQLQEREKSMSNFCDLCSKYILDKQFVYDNTNFKFNIVHHDGAENGVELKDLSSGEKQIVSLFSHLYLSGKENYFVLIDEPELSLSVPWQRRFLCDIKNGGFCTGLVAVTHSPFIYDNELKKYAYSLGELVSGEAPKQ